MSEDFISKLRNQKLFGKKSEPAKVYNIPKQSEKKKQEIKDNKDEDARLDKWFDDSKEWEIILEKFKLIEPYIADEERRLIPDVFIKEMKKL